MSKKKTVVVKEEKDSRIKKLESLLRNSHYVEYEYDRTSCTGECGDDYCRCTKVINPRVESVNYTSILCRIIEIFKKESPITLYCIDRIINRYGLSDTSNWEPEVTGGYYGEEVDGATFCDSEKLITSISELLLKESDDEKIEFILEHEYGYILPDASNKNWRITQVHIGDIKANNEQHYVKLNKDKIDEYCNIVKDDENYIIAICLPNEETGIYRIIDGYHRYTAAEKNKSNNEWVYIVVGENDV